MLGNATVSADDGFTVEADTENITGKKSMRSWSFKAGAAVDAELTSHSYIVPGIGDAGDLAYGAKL